MFEMIIQRTSPLIGRSTIGDRTAELPFVATRRQRWMIAAIFIEIELVLHHHRRRSTAAKTPDTIQPPSYRLVAKRHASMLMELGIVRFGRPYQHEHGTGPEKEHMGPKINVLPTEIPNVEFFSGAPGIGA